MSNLKKIAKFIDAHHVLTLATSTCKEVSACSLFYVFDVEKLLFIVASSEDTTHITHIKTNPSVAGNILLESKTVAKIQGVQFRGIFSKVEDKKLKKLYFQEFPYSKIVNSTLWQIEVSAFKMTDNSLGFSKKLYYERNS